MSTYTPEELNTIATAPMMTGLAVAMIDMGLVSTAVEAAAMAREIAGAAQKYPDNTVIQAVFSETAMKGGQIKFEQPEITSEDLKTGAIVDQAIAAIAAAMQILEGKATPEEITQYREFIYHCGDVVANAAGSGLFGSGTKVSEKEAAALNKIKAALGI